MKYFTFLSLSLLVLSCTNDHESVNKAVFHKKREILKTSEEKLNVAIPDLPSDYKVTKLKSIGLSATLRTPKEADIQLSQIDDSQGKRKLFVINAFKVLSGDFDRDRNFGGLPAQIEVCTTKWKLQNHLDYIRSSSISGWKRAVTEGENYTIYSTAPMNKSFQPIRASDKEVFHFILCIENKLKGECYLIRSSDSYDYSLNELLKLLAIAKTIELI